MEMENCTTAKRMAGFCATAVGRIKWDHGQDRSTPCRAGFWRHHPVLSLCATRGEARRTRDLGGPKATARPDEHSLRRGADHIQGRPATRFRLALPVAQSADGVRDKA